jgi:hypothetical protein
MKYFLVFLVTCNLFATSLPRKTKFKFRPILNKVQKDIESDKLKLRTKIALNAIIKVSIFQLRKNGYANDAQLLKDEWEQRERIYFGTGLSLLDIGDYRPLSEWLAKWYDKLEDAIPPKIFQLTRLKDLKVLNYGIPVAFDPKNSSWDKEEYSKHFVPLSGVITYWSVQASCTIGTSGIGLLIICSIASRSAEKIMLNKIAPKLSDRIYDNANSLIN